MSYDGYSFNPVPLISTLSKNYIRNGAGEIIGSIFSMQLEGTLLTTSGEGSYQTIDSLQDELRTALNGDCGLFTIDCDGSPLLTAYPRILDIQFSKTSNNWVFTTDYTISLEFDDQPAGSGEDSGIMPPYVQSVNEDWQIEFLDTSNRYDWNLAGGVDNVPYQLRLTHNVSAVGKRHCDANGLEKSAWEQARDWVLPKLGYDSSVVTASGVFNLCPDDNWTPYNHFRTNQINKTDGSYSVTETWLVINENTTGIANNAVEDFTITVNSAADDPLTNISVQGTIQGLESRLYNSSQENCTGFNISETKYASASGYWNIIQSRLYDRVNFLAPSGININSTPLNTSIGYNPSRGTINYTYNYNNRPSLCITGSKFESFSINDTNQSDVFASIAVPGRTAGPVLQNINTKTAARKELIVEIVMNPATGCLNSASAVAQYLLQSPKSQVDDIVSAFETNLENNYAQVFKDNDTENWNATNGRYTRNVGWTYQASCLPSPPPAS